MKALAISDRPPSESIKSLVEKNSKNIYNKQ
jgi:hypothetical protein